MRLRSVLKRLSGRKRLQQEPNDGIALFTEREAAAATGVVSTDRLREWDRDKHDRLCEKHFGEHDQPWSMRGPGKIEAFLREFLGKPGLVLCEVRHYPEAHGGHGAWSLGYRDSP